jgi:hypothetical protein
MGREIKQVQFIHRHGDRTPLYEIPYDPIDWVKQLGVDMGELTGTGMNQTYELGLFLHEKYVLNHSLVNPNNSAAEVYVRSTTVDRTIMSATFLQQGLFLGATRFDDINNQNITLPIIAPIVMVPKQDNLLQGVETCPLYTNTLVPQVQASQEWKDKENSLKDFFKWLEDETGFQNIKLSNFTHVADPVFIQNLHSCLHLPDVAAQLTEIIDIKDWAETQEKLVGGRYTGGPFLYSVGSAMDLVVKNDSSAKKLVHHSAHDTTLMTVLAALKLLDSYPRVPDYATAIVFELWKEDNGTFTVNGYIRNGVYRNTSVLAIPSAYNDFQQLVAEMGISDQDWCSQCNVTWNPDTAPATCLRYQYEATNQDTAAAETFTNTKNRTFEILAVTFMSLFTAAVVVIFFLLHKPKRAQKSPK